MKARVLQELNSHTQNNEQKWQFWMDRGGTFTDIIARKPNGEVISHKLLSVNPQKYDDAEIQGIRDILQLRAEDPLPSDKISSIKMGTTIATNALLERTGIDTLLVTTRGFKDQLKIAYQNRPDLFALCIKLPDMLYCEVLEVDERMSAHGQILTPLNVENTLDGLRRHYDNGMRSVAIVLMHGYRYHDHERIIAELARDVGFSQISVSHEVSPLMKLVSRGDTTVVDAYLSPIIRSYVDRVASELGNLGNQGVSLMFMQSGGGLTNAEYFQGKDAILSGPAAGVVGMARVCESAGFTKVIGFDMGGTSTDVSHYNGEFERTFETYVAGVRLRAPMMLIHTVAAGGGSILGFDGARYRVGPDSAGAYPGPACYRNGGPLTITDCNVILGKLQPDLFPKVFGPGADQALDREAVSTRFAELTRRIEQNTGQKLLHEAVATGFLTIAVENMANAIKKISVQRGYDVSEYTLCCFGGAAGQHACMVADALAIKRIIVHPFAGVLSAYGMGLADTVVHKQFAVESTLNSRLLEDINKRLDQLQEDGINDLRQQGINCTNLSFRQLLHVRYQGSDTAIPVANATLAEVRIQFEKAQQMRFGFTSPEKDMIIEFIEVEVISPPMSLTNVNEAGNVAPIIQSETTKKCYMDHEWHITPFYQRQSLIVDEWIEGPVVILDPTSTIVIEPGWKAKVSADSNLLLERYHDKDRKVAVGTDVDPVMLEIFNNLFMSIAEQMGTVLANTATSVNIKERLDFSCAIFDPTGALVANAPHVPVHLGSMGESVKSVIRDHKADMSPGDAYILNAPYNGGTHLPDVTIIKPVINHQAEILFYVAARGHHADIGGKTPGSAPADSTSIEEEGIVIDSFKLVQNNQFREKEIYQILTSGRWPARDPKLNIADFKAQLAACEKGAQELIRMADYYSIATVHAYMSHVQDNAEESVRKVMSKLRDGNFTYEMDDGNKIAVTIKANRENRNAIINFSGTSAQHPGNLNAPTAVVKAAVLYVFRCLVNDDIPLNEGCLKPIEIIIPECSMIDPHFPAAVFAGNVETSQYLVDTLLGALNTVAASQGTMNNFIWGNENLQYYETICGGSGAGKGFHGTDAVHSHMTNSRLTDPEVLEWHFPVLLESFVIRSGSGGNGKYRGGNGVIRKVRFLQDMTANIISSHRQVPPYGLAGGGPGRVGNNRVEHIDGSVTQLSAIDHIKLIKGDVFVIETPGGGAYGKIDDK